MGRSVNKLVPPDDGDLIDRLIRFANTRIQSQQQVYDLFADHPYVPTVTHGDQMVKYIAPLPAALGVTPFLNDQATIRKALDDIVSGDDQRVNGLLATISEKLTGKVNAVQLEFHPGRGSLRIDVRPVLDGLEVILWYAVALIFRHNLAGLLRRCETRLSYGPCDRFFWYRFNLRHYCSMAHARIGRPQARVAAVQRVRQRQKEFKDGERVRNKRR